MYHLGLPYSFLSFQYVEEAIKIAYCENNCGNCSYTVFSCFILYILGGEKKKEYLRIFVSMIIKKDNFQCMRFMGRNKEYVSIFENWSNLE